MSDFDKEAEREKLREKFEQEDESRQATEQMSELLLKGATMTNAHCTDCGDPIFRYDGQEFCPTCQKPVSRDRNEDSEAADDQIEVADPSDDATVQFGASEEAENGTEHEAADAESGSQPAQSQDPGQPQQPADSQSHQPAGSQPPQSADAQSQQPADSQPQHAADPAAAPQQSADQAATQSQRQPVPSADPDNTRDPAAGQSQPSADATVSQQLSEAESLLAETVNRFARQAAAAEDPRAAREQLQAAREAAETLEELRF